MATSGNASLFSASDGKFLLTFVAGMGAFWLSGHLPLPIITLAHNQVGAFALNLALAVTIYGLCMFVWTWLWLGRRRNLRGPLVAASLAMVLAVATSLGLTWMGSARIHLGIGLLAFILYLVYGSVFVIGWLTADRLAKK